MVVNRLLLTRTQVGRWAGGVIVAAVLLAYSNSFFTPFVADDPSSITANPTIRHLWPPWAPLATPRAGGVTVTGRPALNYSLALNYAISGDAVWSYHVVNVAIHLAAALVLFGIVRRTVERLGDPAAAGPVALVSALLWALHPLQTESVTYVIQRAESLMGLAVLLTLYGFIRNVESAHERGWLTLAVVACAVGAATKEVAATAPLLVLLYDRTFVSGTFRVALTRRRWFYGALAATWLPLGLLMLGSGGNRGGSIGFGIGIGWGAHALTQFPAVLHYLRLTLWPAPLVFEYEPEWVTSVGQIVQPALVVGLLLVGTTYAVWRRSPLGFLGAWFFLILAPTSFMPAPSQLISEHRLYLPLAAVVVAIAWSVHSAWGTRGMAILGAAAAAFGGLTYQRNHDYASGLSLWRDTVVKRPRNALAHELYAQALDAVDRRVEALAEHAVAVELRPELAVAQDQLADDLLLAGKIDEAIAHYTITLKLKPDSVDAHNGLGRALAAQNRLPEAIEEFKAALRIAPDFAEAHYNLGNALSAAGRAPDAIAQYEQTLKLKPASFELCYNLANTLAGAGRDREAIPLFRTALAVRPASADGHYNLANSLAATNQTAAAITEYTAALRLQPDFADAHCNLAAALIAQGNLTEAATHYEAALRLRPDFADVREALARLRREIASRGTRP